jgi:hypothetical protein
MVDRGRYAVARRRETIDQLLQGELTHPFAPKVP